VIEQYTITTTPKYNFPYPTTDTTFPQHFKQLALHSLQHVQNHSFQLNQHEIQQDNIDAHALQLKLQPLPLKRAYEETAVAAVDTSNIKIGETSTGTLIAVRGATVYKQKRSYRYTRIGPYIFHITENNKKEVYNTLQKTLANPLQEQTHTATPNLQQMPTRIANLLEKWLQTTLTKTAINTLILFDGSLTGGTPETPIVQMKQILETARKNNNTVMAFSKMTNLRFNGYLITEIPLAHKPPYLIETENLKPKPPFVLFGDVYVARLTSGNYAFRLDVDKQVPQQQQIRAIEKLLGNDHLSQSYPETLRLAHILCTFTANEVIAMKHYIARRYGLKIINRPDMHRLLFGPFGKGEGYS